MARAKRPKKRRRSKRKAPDDEEGIYDLTSGDLARLLSVDLKTIHNWVKHKHIYGRRTRGRHLRFHRAEVVRFLRRYGYPVPSVVGESPARVLLAGSLGARGRSRLSLRGAILTARESLVEAVLDVASGQQDVLVLNLDSLRPALLVELVETMRSWPATRGMGLVGLSRAATRRRTFVERGGDAALAHAHETEVGASVRWLLGTASKAPRHALLAET